MSAFTRGPGTLVSSSVGTAAASALAAKTATNFLQIENTHSTQYLAYTTDGTVPVVNGNGFTLAPYGSVTFDMFIPTGVITVIGSGSATTYSILWA